VPGAAGITQLRAAGPALRPGAGRCVTAGGGPPRCARHCVAWSGVSSDVCSRVRARAHLCHVGGSVLMCDLFWCSPHRSV
jgi:hypothetical protein